MELKFIGKGSCFNFDRGNNSAYMKWGENNESMLLIDCGCNICEKIVRNNLLDGVNNLYIAITHLHDDHSGSLGQLIDYCYYVKNIIVNLIFPPQDTIEVMLSTKMISINKYKFLCGCYSYTNEGTSWFRLGNKGPMIKFTPTSHKEGYDSFSILLSDEDTTILYTGDTNNLDINGVNNEFSKSGDKFKLYTECTFTPEFSNVHVYYKTLFGIPEEYRKNVTVMHLDNNSENIQELREAGFNIAESELRVYTNTIHKISPSTVQQFNLNSYKSNINDNLEKVIDMVKDNTNIEIELPIVQRSISTRDVQELFGNINPYLQRKKYKIDIPEIKYTESGNMMVKSNGLYGGTIIDINGIIATCVFNKRVLEDNNIDINKCAISFMGLNYLIINKTIIGMKDAILVIDVDRYTGKYEKLKKELKDPKDHDIQVSTGTLKDIITHPEKYEDLFKEE